MSIPTHGPFCQTLVYPTRCWDCQQEIFVLECSCGSAVLFDQLGVPWPKHACSGRYLGGWGSAETLLPDGDRPASRTAEETESNIKRVDPTVGEQRSLLAVVRELHASTKRTAAIEALPEFGIRLLGLDPAINYWQITLVDNGIRPNESFTALLPGPVARGLKQHVMVMVEMTARGSGGQVNWVITDINPI